LQEEGGGRWGSYFTCPRNEWLQVEVDASDFTLMEGSDNPPDPNGKLDMDKVSAIGIADFAQMLVQAPNPELLKLLGITPGTRTFFLDDVAAYGSSLPPALAVVAPGTVKIDTFARSQPMWVAIGTAAVAISTEAPLKARGLKVDYTRGAGSIAAVMRSVPKGKLAGATQLVLSLASKVGTRLLVQFEEVGGAKYNATIEVARSTELAPARVSIADMQRSEETQDANGKLDLDQVHQIVLIDPTGLMGGSDETQNTLHIASIMTRSAAR